MADAPDPSLRSGTMVGPYRIDHRVGGGGMGTVYAAEDPTIRKRVALKVLRSALADDAGAAARFEREARAANDVRHPGIVDVIAMGRLPDGRPYLVMSLLDGRSLRDEIAARGSLPPAEAWIYVRQVAEALAAAHAEGVIHRDIKADNVFLERHGGATSSAPARARVLDFGLAKVEEGHDEEPVAKLTQTGVPMGTPAYMAPEQWWGQAASPATDQYALGAMLFESCAGRPPFGSQQFVQLLNQHLHDAPPRLADVGVAVPEGVEALIARALAKAPADRFASMNELLAAGDDAFAAIPSITADGAPSHRIPRSPPLAATTGVTSELASAPTLFGDALASRPSAIAQTGAGEAAPIGRFAVAHAATLAAGIAAILAVGYAGPGRHMPREWLIIAGIFGPASVALLVAGAVGLAVAARRRATSGHAGVGAWVLALAPGLIGGLGTYGGWQTIASRIESWPPTDRFTTFSLGMYEANAGRFIGQAGSCVLCLGLCALAGVAPGPPVPAAPGARREALAATVGLAALAVLALALGAPSGAIVAGAAAAAVGIGLAVPRRGPQAREIERALAGAVAVALAAAVGIARVEGRETVLWDASPTRAARAAEILAAAHERTATEAIALAAAVAFLLHEALRLRRAGALAAVARPRAATAGLAVVVGLATTGDVVAHGRVQQKREDLRAALAQQFALFAELDPPSGDAIAGAPGARAEGRFAPHRAAALQIARRTVGVNATPTALLAALESDEGGINLGRDLAHALAEAAAKASPGDPSLSIAIDGEVPWRSAARALGVAHKAGARRVELLLTRGARPQRVKSGPPEASWVMPGDFVALPVDLGDDGFAPGPGDRFADVAAELSRRAIATDGAVRLSVR